MRRRYLLVGSLILVCAAMLALGAGVNSTAAADDDTAAITKKLDTVIQNQERILNGIAALQEELNIVKIRVTQAQ